jgi:hypothetical protein
MVEGKENYFADKYTIVRNFRLQIKGIGVMIWTREKNG